MEKLIERCKLIGKEVINILTNVVVPLMGPIILIAEITCPAKVVAVLKNVEYFLFEFCGTKDDIK